MKVLTSSIVLLMMLFAIGCQDEIIVSPDDDNPGVSLTITGLPDEIAGVRGSIHNLPIRVIINRLNGSVASGVKVGMSTNNQAATLNPALGNTDGSGTFETTLNVVIPYGSSVLQVTASSCGVSASKSIQLTGTPLPHRIILNVDAAIITVPTGQSGIINFEAVVTDSIGVSIPGVQLNVMQYPAEGDSGIFGALTKPLPTDLEGRTTFLFNSYRGFGGLVIRVSTDIPGIETLVEAEIPIRIVPLESEVAYFNLAADPDEIIVAPGQLETSTIRAQVMDTDRQGIPNLRVNFDTDLGSIASSGVTDQNGMIETDFITDFQYGQATITAAIPNSEWSETVNLEIRSERPSEGTLDISTGRPGNNTKYADNGYSFVTFHAVLKDDDGQLLTGRTIESSTTFGVVTPLAITDSLGRATIFFTDTGEPSVNEECESVPAVITFSYPPFNLHATWNIYILPLPEVTRIDLATTAQQVVAGSMDWITANASAFRENGSPAIAGTQIRFNSFWGSFTDEIVVIDESGRANSNYIAANRAGIDTLIAYWYNRETHQHVYSNQVLITVLPGPPGIIQLESDRYELLPGNTAVITAHVLDAHRNPVRAGTYVGFTASSGYIMPSALTDDDGYASISYTAGGESGSVKIIAFAAGENGVVSDTLEIYVGVGRPNHILLTADPTILPRACGCMESSLLRATVLDAHGNLVYEPTTVVFQLLNQPRPPAGCNINETYPCDSVVTVNGVAQASLNSGREIGGVILRAYTWRDSMRTDTVSVINASIQVVTGPPFQLDIDVDSRGEDVGGGAWMIEVSARVWDIFHYPVEDGIPVTFFIEPEVASITSGRTAGGVAIAELVYHSQNTFEEVTITARVATQDGILENSRVFDLPLQHGNLSLNVDPENWMFCEGQEESFSRCWVILRDGHNVLINNAPVLFGSSRGLLRWYNVRRNDFERFYPDPARMLTGLFDQENREEPGQATVYLISEESDIFLDPFTLQTTVSISAEVEGYDDVRAQPRYIQFTRHG